MKNEQNNPTPKEVTQLIEETLKDWGIDNIRHSIFYVSRQRDMNFCVDEYCKIGDLKYFISDYDYWFQVRFYNGINKKFVIGNYLHTYNGSNLKPNDPYADDVVIEKDVKMFATDFSVELLEIKGDINTTPIKINKIIEILQKLAGVTKLIKKI